MKSCDKNQNISYAKIQWLGELNQAGMQACSEGQVERAEANLILAVHVSKSTRLPCLEAKALNNLGVFYASQKVWDKAVVYLEQALGIVHSGSHRKSWLCKAIQKNIMEALHVH